MTCWVFFLLFFFIMFGKYKLPFLYVQIYRVFYFILTFCVMGGDGCIMGFILLILSYFCLFFIFEDMHFVFFHD